MLMGASGQDLGAMSEVLVRGFMGKVKVQFVAAVAQESKTMPFERHATQSEGVRVHVEPKRKLPHTTRKQRKSNNVT